MTTQIIIDDPNLISWPGVETDGSDITVECIGGGAGGSKGAGGWVGAGGGEYRRSVVPYVSGTAIPIHIGPGGTRAEVDGIGTDGEDTTWNTNVVVAKGGRADLYGGTGGTGDVGYKGGDGAAGYVGQVSSGGGAAGELGDGGVGISDGIGGAGNGVHSGAGGDAQLVPGYDGNSGLPYGGAGGGAINGNGGVGFCGVIIITYTAPVPPPPQLKTFDYEPNWENGINASYRFQTVITSGETGKEQRAALLQVPVRKIKARFFETTLRNYLTNIVRMYHASESLYVPLYNEPIVPVEGALNYGDSLLTTQAVDCLDISKYYNANNMQTASQINVVLMDITRAVAYQTKLATIISPTHLHFVGAITNSFYLGKLIIYPIMNCYISAFDKVVITNNKVAFDIEFTEII